MCSEHAERAVIGDETHARHSREDDCRGIGLLPAIRIPADGGNTNRRAPYREERAQTVCQVMAKQWAD